MRNWAFLDPVPRRAVPLISGEGVQAPAANSQRMTGPVRSVLYAGRDGGRTANEQPERSIRDLEGPRAKEDDERPRDC